MDRKKWFIDRVGKRIYRSKTVCDCNVCSDVYRNGLVIKNENHAVYIYYIECESKLEGTNIKYFDTREEVMEYEKRYC